MSTTITPSRIQDLAAQITQRFDTNRDGKISTQEFTDFLTALLTATNPSPTFATPAMAAAVSTPPANRIAVGTMAGFDPNKLANLSHDTFKYKLGRILQYYPNTPDGLQQAMPEIQQAFPDAKLVSKDKVDFGALGVIDLIQSAGAGGVAWQFLPVGS
jgi:hypothetical protein